jgi:hypothetical protein
MKILLLLLTSLTLIVACQSSKNAKTSMGDSAPAKVFAPEATAVLAKALKAHGGDKYEKAHYRFVFRKKTFTFHNNGAEYRYESVHEKDGVTTVDMLDNDMVSRTINGKSVELSEKQKIGISGSLNSVIYFATLPYKLTDASVNIASGGKTSIKGKAYDILHVTFDQAGGGVDYDDQYRYWINSKTDRIDYLAYNYQTGNGGVRFREAYNSRMVDGILFQDYVNYAAPVGTPLDDLPGLFEKGQLRKLSVIDTEDVVAL